MITSKELREKYLEFFEEKGHKVIPSASLVPENDPSVLFTTAGMHPLVPFLMGEKHPAGKRLVNFQKCIRTGDIDKVGNQWHLTFFEMLGNWSLGDYFKRQAIEWSFEFLTSKKWLGIPAAKLAVSVFKGDKDAPADDDSYNVWLRLGIPKERIYKYDKKENWWGPAGATGPCGPDTEMFYISDKKACGPNCQPSCECGKYVEIWNDVFLEYNLNTQDKYEPLKQKNVDTGMGVERTVAVLNNYQDNFQELLKPIIEKIEKLSGKSYTPPQSPPKLGGEVKGGTRSMRIIADHLRAATFIMGDDLGISPSNIDQGYVVRKLIRRAIRHGRLIGIQENFTHKLGEVVIKTMKDIYPELEKNKKFVLENFQLEEEKFTRTLQAGLKELMKIFEEIEMFKKGGDASAREFGNYSGVGDKLFYVFSTYGFPLELSMEILEEKRAGLNFGRLSEVEKEKIKKGFEKEFKKHQELSRTASAGKFRGGLGEHSEMAIKYHTATHLLHAALRQVLGEHVAQKGSNITDKRLRFDFTHHQKMTEVQKKKVEAIINQQIKKDLPVKMEEMSLEEAKRQGAIGLFGSKYGDKVKVYSVNKFSKEICGGPHVDRIGKLGKFKIIKEEASSAGVRRIKAVLE